jgi:hypothetical protein
MQHSPNTIEQLAESLTPFHEENASEPNHAPVIIVRLDLLPIFVDPHNWEWKAEDKAEWKLAKKHWQDFFAKWYGATETQSASLVDPDSPYLSLDSLPPDIDPDISSRIFIRNSYVTVFDTLWQLAMAYKGRKGVIITGQPGTGACLPFHIHRRVR